MREKLPQASVCLNRCFRWKGHHKVAKQKEKQGRPLRMQALKSGLSSQIPRKRVKGLNATKGGCVAFDGFDGFGGFGGFLPAAMTADIGPRKQDWQRAHLDH